MEKDEKNCSNGKENGFSVEMKSRDHLDTILFSEDTRGVLIEGTLGELETFDLFEEAVLVVKGTKGTLMVDLIPEALKEMVQGGEEV